MPADFGGFHYKGKDKRGVSQWKGSRNWQRILNVGGIGMMVYGACAGAVMLTLLLYALFTLSWPAVFSVILFVSGIHTLAFGSSGLWMRGMAQHIRLLDTADQLSARFGVNEETLAAVAQDKDIKPRMNINGVDYYNPADFAKDALTLLRGATRPDETQEVLLRPATSDSPTAPEQLLRVPNADVDSAQTVTHTPSISSYLQDELVAEANLQELRQ